VERKREKWKRLVGLLPQVSPSRLSIVNREENSVKRLCALSSLAALHLSQRVVLNVRLYCGIFNLGFSVALSHECTEELFTFFREGKVKIELLIIKLSLFYY
jgi:hypothetical protein